MKMFIPELGTNLTLIEPWTFTLYNEGRNEDLIQALGFDADEFAALKAEYAEIYKKRWTMIADRRRVYDEENWRRYDELDQKIHGWSWIVTLPAGTVLRVDRIYIRKGASDYSSVSFYVEKTSLHELTPVKKGGGFKGGRKRFWAKLADVNQMIIENIDN